MSRSTPCAATRAVTRVALLVALAASPARAADLHVDAAAACPGDGTPATPYCTVQSAIDAATDGDRVLVAPGLYIEAIDYLGKAIEVESTAGPATTILESPDGSSVVTFDDGEGPDSVLRGFTVRGGVGTAVGSPFGAVVGGGVYCGGSSPTIDGNIISGNGLSSFGGGIFVSGSPTISHNLIVANTAFSGAGLACLAGSPHLEENIFRLNGDPVDTIGGGVFLQNASAVLLGNTFEDNLASFGGGFYAENSGLELIGNVFTGNTAADEGGAVGLFNGVGVASGNTFDGNGAGFRGGAVASLFFSDVTWSGNVFTGNVASEGGAVACYGSSQDDWTDDVFDGNTALSGAGGALWLQGASVLVRRAVVRGSRGFGGAVRLSGGARITDSAVVDNDAGIDGNNSVVLRCTVAGNAFTGISADSGNNLVTGCVAWGNGTLDLVEAGGVLTVTYSTTPGGWPGAGNDGADPLFLDAPGGDYALSAGSPCIDTGDPEDLVAGTDVVGGGRRVDGLLDGGSRVDRGAFEFSHARITALQPSTPADPIGFTTSGTPGLPTWVFLALGTDVLCVEPYGTFLVDLGGPWILRFAGFAPTSIAVPQFPGASGITAYLQAVATTPDGTLGTTSNVDAFTFP